jgi:hypothetical protein
LVQGFRLGAVGRRQPVTMQGSKNAETVMPNRAGEINHSLALGNSAGVLPISGRRTTGFATRYIRFLCCFSSWFSVRLSLPFGLAGKRGSRAFLGLLLRLVLVHDLNKAGHR